MKNLTFKTKILILSLLPLLTVSLLIIYIASYQANELGSKNIDSFSSTIFELRRSEIKHYTDIAKSALDYYGSAEFDDQLSPQETAKQLMRNVRYGEDGYFFVYDNYTTLVNPSAPVLEGRNQRTMEDPNGVRLIEDLYEQAMSGGGFTNYAWLKPSRGRVVDKISYADQLENWDWWVGTGLYVDDLEDSIAAIRSSVDENIATTVQIISSLAFGAVALAGLVGARLTLSEGNLADARLKDLSHRIVGEQEEERRRVALALQENILRPVNLVKNQLKSSTDHAGEEFRTALSAINKTIEEVYRISGELRPESLDEKGLTAAIEELANQASSESDIKFSFMKSADSERLEPELEIAVYRIAQEAIKNVINHSKAGKSRVRLRLERRMLTLTVQDNGVGFDARAFVQNGTIMGAGLVDMRVRAESQGGRLTVFSSNGTGTIVKAEIPFS
ncbi:cache domain-containing protein [Marinobacter confluentis]|uniref:histidine kinase n=1 Tax=Marinobacter confluentis TaxID=1697557 RepID=A0A4Z1CFC2_9GAMM|nr:cache domain-containing protein [Marinobacter confluentis]TGN38744.1 hypothetical protein E5Q11_13465 [Marinobacter confluentis]